MHHLIRLLRQQAVVVHDPICKISQFVRCGTKNTLCSTRFKDGVIVIDYSQIELRVLAHLSNDKAMIQAFNEGQDIHQATAAMVFQVPYSDVTKPHVNRRNS